MGVIVDFNRTESIIVEKHSVPYGTHDADMDHLIDNIVGKFRHAATSEVVREIISTAVKFGKESENIADLRLANAALKEIRHSCKVFAPYRSTPKVIVFGSARSKPGSPEYQMAEAFSHAMGAKGYMVVTGGGPGVMEAGNKGAQEGMDFALNIRLPFEQKHNPFVEENEKLINYKYFFTRKLFFVKETDATAVFPGGFGTLDEGFEMLTLVQTGKSRPRPIVLMEPEGMHFWSECKTFLDRQLFGNGFVGKDDSHLYTIATSVDEAVAYIAGFYRVYHSIRFEGSLTIIRLNQLLSAAALKQLNSEFGAIVSSGEIIRMAPTERERAENDHVDLPRLGFHFNRREFGRLYAMIHLINKG